jgi:hypothetical protein
VLDVDVAGQRRDVAAAMMAPAATTALPDVAGEMGGECLEKGVGGIGLFSAAGEGPKMANGGQERMHALSEDDANLI